MRDQAYQSTVVPGAAPYSTPRLVVFGTLSALTANGSELVNEGAYNCQIPINAGGSNCTRRRG